MEDAQNSEKKDSGIFFFSHMKTMFQHIKKNNKIMSPTEVLLHASVLLSSQQPLYIFLSQITLIYLYLCTVYLSLFLSKIFIEKQVSPRIIHPMTWTELVQAQDKVKMQGGESLVWNRTNVLTLGNIALLSPQKSTKHT